MIWLDALTEISIAVIAVLLYSILKSYSCSAHQHTGAEAPQVFKRPFSFFLIKFLFNGKYKVKFNYVVMC